MTDALVKVDEASRISCYQNTLPKIYINYLPQNIHLQDACDQRLLCSIYQHCRASFILSQFGKATLL